MARKRLPTPFLQRVEHEPGGRHRPADPCDHDITAAGERGSTRLLEHHLAHAEQRRHDPDAQAEADAQYRRPHRMRHERFPGDRADHLRRLDPAVTHEERPPRA